MSLATSLTASTTMSLTASETPLIRYMVYAPDKSDEGALARRLSVRAKHLEVAAANVAANITRTLLDLETCEMVAHIVAGIGAVLLSPDENKKMVGSMFIVEVDSLEE